MGDKRIEHQPESQVANISTATDKKFHPYPRPIVAVDIALLTLEPERGLVVVEMERGDTGEWALPGAFLRGNTPAERETLDQAVERCLRDKLGVEGVRPHQLRVFDAPGRDHRDWVISVAHLAVVRTVQLKSLGSGSATRTRTMPVDRPDVLVWDHPEIVKLAKNYVRDRYKAAADPDRFLGTRFTLRELRQVHSWVAGKNLDRDRFRRAMEHLIEPTQAIEENTGSRGRPAQYFRRKS
ncbi:MAG: NUDIX hydrolase [Candidatus Nanopelagicales bacterium]